MDNFRGFRTNPAGFAWIVHSENKNLSDDKKARTFDNLEEAEKYYSEKLGLLNDPGESLELQSLQQIKSYSNYFAQGKRFNFSYTKIDLVGLDGKIICRKPRSLTHH